MKLNIVAKGLIAAALIGVVVSHYAAWDGSYWRHANAVPTHAATITGGDRLGMSGHPVVQSLPDFVSIAEKNGAAVVNITVTQQVRSANRSPVPKLNEDNPLFDHFHRFQGPMPQDDEPAFNMGSGFIVSADGYILTNAHVIANAKEVTVKLNDRREFEAKVIGADRRTDVAVVKIDASNLPTVKFGNPAETKVGAWVVAIGSPFGFENSLTSGIVSAKSRSLPDETYVPFIQTDAAVNPGNSGGPLFNVRGEVIGINSQIYSRSGGYEGVSFAIPIDVAANVKDQLIAHGKVTRGRLGIEIQDVTQALADSFGLKQTAGALVSSVEQDSPAAETGIEAGDVIVKFAGNAITLSSELPPLVSATKPGAIATLLVWRRGSNRNIDVKLGELKDPSAAFAQ